MKKRQGNSSVPGNAQKIIRDKINKIGIIALTTFILAMLSIQILASNITGEGEHTFQIEGRTDISTGLPKKASFTTVEVKDADSDGLDEIYLGGAGRNEPKTPGIRAYEYDNSLGEWKEFGQGLPGKDSSKYYGALSFGDIDNDGDIDLIAPLHNDWYDGKENGIEVYAGDGEGGFSLEYTINTGESTTESDVADLDNDGNLDIACSTENALRVWYGNGTVNMWSEMSPPRANNEITGMDAGDLNDDGLLDLVGCPYSGSNKIRMYIQAPNRTWDEVPFKNVHQDGFGIKIVDIDNDGTSDIIYGTRNEGMKAWLGNNGGSPGGVDFQWRDGSAGLHDSGGFWNQLELQDITGDGKPELIAANNGGDDIYLYINDHPNGWTWIFTGDSSSNDAILKEDPLTIGGEPYGANFGDWDGDGYLDCAACTWGTGVKAWLINGNGSNQTEPITYPEGGKTPPWIWGYDDYNFVKTFLLYGLGAAGLTAMLALIAVFVLKIKKKKKKKKEKKDGIWLLITGNVSITIGAVILILFHIIGIEFSMNYEPDAEILSLWNPPEFIGILLCSFFGFISFLIFFEIGRLLTMVGITKLKKKTNDDNDDYDLRKTISMSRTFIILTYIIAYSNIAILAWLIKIFNDNESGINNVIIFSIAFIPLAMLFFNFANNIISIRTKKARIIPFFTIITNFLMVLVTIILLIPHFNNGSDLKELMLFYPLINGIFIIIWTILNIVTLRGSHILFVADEIEENDSHTSSSDTNP